ncbi:methyl-accepting chemotaxis protein [Rhizobium sp. FKY42]|uniref:methyl-accepting chemotaxis protein n=1 Tax=Rhizobium sp. FKY42 TaxID=2562310 RepID=UPI001484F191|nr:methyl-accepting chemotaxis protein [Rhizobium sp. FKY42]
MRSIHSLSLTAKLAGIIISINLVGILGLAFLTWKAESENYMLMASRNWSQTTNQFATLSAGGVKWGKADVVADAYALYRNDPTLQLVQFTAFNADLKPVNTWARADVRDLPSENELLKAAEARPEKPSILPEGSDGQLFVITAPLPADKNGKAGGYVVATWTAEAILQQIAQQVLLAISFQVSVVFVSLGIFVFAMRRIVGQPLKLLSARISALQEGDLEGEVVFQHKGDEMGFLARSIERFRKDAIDQQAHRHLAEAQQATINEERSRNALMAEQNATTQRRIISDLGSALERLAQGDLDARLRDLGPEFEKLQADFNRMVDAVATTITEIKEAAENVQGGAGDLSNQAEQLAKRTEQQAAALEETAAAIEQVTVTVRASSQRASNTGAMVNNAKTEAHHSAHVVRNAIGAMDRIQHSSSQIGQIIGVIDEIAFQTNLLALNAGVEAARAGEAGKGFAVVAQEVRELAQRSANAAKEIKQLVQVSNAEVGSGVELVNQTGDALLKIEQQITAIAEGIGEIVESYRQQSAGLQEINTSVNSMDHTTQQNAAMVEEVSAASHDLLAQSRILQTNADRFRLSSAGGSGPFRRVA